MKKRYQWKTTEKTKAIDDKPNNHYKNKKIFTCTILFVFDRYHVWRKVILVLKKH